MAYEFILREDAQDDLRRIGGRQAKRILKKLEWFAAQPSPLVFARMLTYPAPGDVRFRVGEYRIIAVVNAEARQIEITSVGHRKDIYR